MYIAYCREGESPFCSPFLSGLYLLNSAIICVKKTIKGNHCREEGLDMTYKYHKRMLGIFPKIINGLRSYIKYWK